MRGRLTLLGAAACVVAGVTGQAIVTQAIHTVFEHQGSPFPVFAFDTGPIWATDWALLHGAAATSALGVYGNWYPPPLELLFLPLGLAPSGLANGITVALCGALLIGVLLAWSRAQGRVSLAIWPALFSAPVTDLMLQDQLTSAIWLAAASLVIWAQGRGRWLLCGTAAALACIRPDSALPLLVALLWVTMQQPRALLRVVAGGALVLGPPTLLCFVWDPAWPAHYLHSVGLYPATGLFGVAKGLLGPYGPPLLTGLVCLAAVVIVRKERPISLDRAAAVLSVTILAGPLEGMYCAAVTLPALLRVGLRPGMAAAPWLVAMAPWAVVFLMAPILLGSDPALAINLLPLTGLWMMGAGVAPLVWPKLPAAASMGRKAA